MLLAPSCVVFNRGVVSKRGASFREGYLACSGGTCSAIVVDVMVKADYYMDFYATRMY